MSTEIELKLLLPGTSRAKAVAALHRIPALAGVAATDLWLLNRYFDSPSFTLRQQRAALRVRQVRCTPPSAPSSASAVWLQTFKTAGVSQGGLSQRGEWEHAVPGEALDEATLRTTPWADLDPQGLLFAQLQPCFDTHCHRTTWQVQMGLGNVIELALDAGEIVAGPRKQQLLELELELLSGEPQALFQLAQAIGQHLAILPCDVSKAERGYALAQGVAHTAVPARPTRLRPHTTPVQAACQVLGEVFDQLTRNLAGMDASDDPELVHQTRVAWRRWRSACRLFRPWLPAQPDRTALRPLFDALGQCRELDVAHTETTPTWAPAFVQHKAPRHAMVDAATQLLVQAAQNQRNLARQALHKPETGLVWLALAQWLQQLAVLATAPPASSRKALRHWAQSRMNKLHRRLQAALLSAQGMAAGAPLSHQARLLAKRTRYTAETLAGWLPTDQAKEWRQAATHLQRQLGNSRDLAQTIAWLQQLGAAPEWTAFLQGVAAALPDAKAALEPPPR